MAFVKLDAGILESTLWMQRDQRDVFITALLMTKPTKFGTTVEQIAQDSTQPTGYTLPAGWYGFVASSGAGIVRRACLPHADGMAALRALTEPDPESRSTAYEGRRMLRVDGGYIVLNYMHYRERRDEEDRREQNRIAKQNSRARAAQAKAPEPRAEVMTGDDTLLTDADSQHVSAMSAQAEAEVEEEAKDQDQEHQRDNAAKKANAGKTGRRGTRLPDDWEPSETVRVWAKAEHPHVDLRRVLEEFRDYWRALPGQKGTKTDWDATFRNRVRDVAARSYGRRDHAGSQRLGGLGRISLADQSAAIIEERNRERERAGRRSESAGARAEDPQRRGIVIDADAETFRRTT